MAAGKTLELVWFSRTARSRKTEEYTTNRNRALRGKARIKARKAANKGG